MQTSDRNGSVVGAVQVCETDEIMLISDKGTLVRTRVDEVSVQGRNTQGVRLIRLKNDEKLVGLEQVDEPEVDEFAEAAESFDSDEAPAPTDD
jgi:DNA gyrase subunit A